MKNTENKNTPERGTSEQINAVVRISRSFEMDKLQSLTNKEMDIFTAILADAFGIKDKPGTLVHGMFQILKIFDVKMKDDYKRQL